MRLIEFTNPTCGACRQQRSVLARWAVRHSEVRVEVLDVAEDARAARLFGQTGSMTFPTLAFVEGERVIYAEPGMHDAAGLDRLIESARRLA